MITHCDAMDLATAERTRRDLTRYAVPIGKWTVLRPTKRPICLPAFSLDCRRHPDIVDLLRVHVLESGAGDNHTAWKVLLDPRGPSLSVLQVNFYTPASCTFTLAFTPGHRLLLKAIAAADMLFVTTRRNILRSAGLGLDISTAELRQGLILHDLLTGGQSREAGRG
jgi:hypothetical protein